MALGSTASPSRRFAARLLAASLFLVPVTAPAALAAYQPENRQVATVGELSSLVWNKAKAGEGDAALLPLKSLPESDVVISKLRASSELLATSIAKRETQRAEKLAELNKEFAEALAKPRTARTLSDALKAALEMHIVSAEKDAVLADPKIIELVAEAEAAARDSESKHQWLMANELFYRLSLLKEEEGTFRDDVKRLSHRLNLMRLYVPERFWELRNEAVLAEGKKALPPYNALGEGIETRLRGIRRDLVRRAVARALAAHVDREKDSRDLAKSAIEYVRSLVTTVDLQAAFPGIVEATARAAMEAALQAEMDRLAGATGKPESGEFDSMLDRILEANKMSVMLPEAAVLREFGDGVMAELDEFSGVIWPDEFARFKKMIESDFVGVGVQIQMDEETQLIKVVTPLEGTPAQRAGIRQGDLIKKINGISAVGVSLNQAVDQITGEKGTKVRITIEREGQDIEYELERAKIAKHSVKGWKRLGAKEDEWDWFIDPENKVGYIRLTDFTPETTIELHRAIEQMKGQGLAGLILDLRFNPGGLLTEAVSVSNTFIPSGVIVSTTGGGQPERARPEGALIRGVPVAVLVNEGSASASEIVSGAIKHYADNGMIRAIVVGERSFGKGSVQNVWDLSGTSMLKLTTQYYRLPDGRILHRKPGAKTWGVDPHVKVEMLPEQITGALKLRQDADVLPIDQSGNIVWGDKEQPNPDKLIADGLDLQLQYALLLMQSQTLDAEAKHVRLN
ncbi:MAG: S41 family peptidase [Phycisphaerales bacterium]|nr:S41 family peptidase [Phycisphaerales bacterium]